MTTVADRITRQGELVIVHGLCSSYIVTTLDLLDENLRTCNVDDDYNLLLDART